MARKKQRNPRQQLAQKIVTAKKGNTRRGGRKPMPKGLALGRQGRRKISVGQSGKGWSKITAQFTPEQAAIINEYEAAGKPIGTVEKGISMIPSGGTPTVMPQIRPPVGGKIMPQIRPPKRRKMRRY